MDIRWRSFLRKHNKQLGIITGAFCALFLCGIVIFNAKKIDSNFNPNQYADDYDSKDNQVDYDSTVFGSNENSQDGMEMDQNSKEDYHLDDGNENILDKKQQGMSLSDGNGTGTGDNNGNALGITNDGTGTQIAGGSGNGNNQNGLGGTGSNQGIPGGNENGGSGNGGSGGINPSDPGDHLIPENPHDSQYGIDYGSAEKAPTFKPGSGVKVTSIEVTRGDLKQHFYEGEAPRIEEMDYYLTVRAVLSNGTKQTLKYRPNDETGGDYTISWGNNPLGANRSEIGYPTVGSDVGEYTATISYGDCKPVELKYDIVKWQIKLNDFDEPSDPTEDPYTQDYAVFPLYLSPKDSPIVNLNSDEKGEENAIQNMYNLAAAKTQSMDEESGYEYSHKNKKLMTTILDWFGEPILDDNGEPMMEESDYCYVQYFGGWKPEGEKDLCGASYKMVRPKDNQIVGGVYTVDMEPTWQNSENDEDYVISLNGSLEWGEPWTTELLRYSGESTTLTIPEGVTKLSFIDYSLADDMSGRDMTEYVEKLVIPASLDAFEFFSEGWAKDAYELFPNLKEIEVSADNPFFLSVDGVLYNKTGKNLIYVPAMKDGIREWSSRVEEIGSNAFRGNIMETLSVPESVTQLDEFCFCDATIDQLIINSTSSVTIGEAAFDTDWNWGAGIAEIELKTSSILYPYDDPVDWYVYLHMNGENLADSGVKIIIPDSKDDVDYLNLIKTLSQTMDLNSGIMGEAFAVLGTSKGAEEHYQYQDGLLLSADEETLYQASTLLAGTVKLPETLMTIKAEAFTDCDQIQNLFAPATLESVGERAFANMWALKKLYWQGIKPPTLETLIFGDTIPDELQVYVPKSAYDKYMHEEQPVLDRDYGSGTTEKLLVEIEGLESTIVDNGNLYYVTDDGTYCLYKVDDHTKGIFTPREGTVEFMDGCFTNCTELEGVVLPDSLTKIGHHIFTGCNSVKILVTNLLTAPTIETDSLDMSNSVITYIPQGAKIDSWTGFHTEQAGDSYLVDEQGDGIAGVYALTEAGGKCLYASVLSSGIFRLRSNTIEICDKAFYGQTNLRGVSNGSRLRQIGAHAFEGCTSLYGVEATNVQSLGTAAFKGCTALRNLKGTGSSVYLYIPSNLNVLPDECFQGCQFSRIIFHTEVSALGNATFKDCNYLSQIISTNPMNNGTYYSLPYKLTEVPESCFENCSNVSIVDIQEGVTTIKKNAFKGCTGLTRSESPKEGEPVVFEFPQSLATIEEGSFSNTGIENVRFLKAPTNIGDLSTPEGITAVLNTYFENCTLTSFVVEGTDYLKRPLTLNVEMEVQIETTPEVEQPATSEETPSEEVTEEPKLKEEIKPEETQQEKVAEEP